jgi:hypothetical protein
LGTSGSLRASACQARRPQSLAAELVWVAAHAFRKTTATILEAAGQTPRQVADQLGGQRSILWSTDLPRLANGTWGGALYVPSTANGTFKVSGVMTGPYFPNSGRSTTPSPYPGPALPVTGTHSRSSPRR